MNAKDKFNLSLPVPLKAEFDRVAKGYGHGGMGLAFAAAVQMFLEAGPGIRNDYVSDVSRALLTKQFDTLLSRIPDRDGAGSATGIRSGAEPGKKAAKTARRAPK